jgi:uncharacterized protein
MPTVLITGGTGLIGKALTKLLLEKEYEVIILSRKPPAGAITAGLAYAAWNPKEQTIDAKAIGKADYIIHLAGAGVADKRWTNKRKQEIRESRTMGSGLVVKALKEIPNQVKAVVSASGIGWYMPSAPIAEGSRMWVETDPYDTSFLGETCRQWEQEIDPVGLLGKRLIKLRTGIVLSNDGGALPEFRKPIRFGIAAVLGSGRQMISWIHIDDLCRLYLDAIQHDRMEGVFNAVAPKPVDNKTFILSVAKHMKGKFFISFYVPAFLLKLFLGEMSIEVLKSANVSAGKIKNTGFQFLYPSLAAALENLQVRLPKSPTRQQDI